MRARVALIGLFGALACRPTPEPASVTIPQSHREPQTIDYDGIAEKLLEDLSTHRYRGPSDALVEYAEFEIAAGALRKITHVAGAPVPREPEWRSGRPTNWGYGDEEPRRPAYSVAMTAQFDNGTYEIDVFFDAHGRITSFEPWAGTVEKSAGARWTAPAYAERSAFDEKPVTVASGPGLPGTLSLPHGGGPFPAVMLVHTWGEADADESGLATNAILGVDLKPFKDIAWALASRGIAVLRYEKRNHVGAPFPAEHVPDQKVEVEDAAHAALALLRSTPRIDAKRIVLLGHGQGGYLAPRMAASDSSVRALILFAAPTRHRVEALLERARAQAARPGSYAQWWAMQVAALEQLLAESTRHDLAPDDLITVPYDIDSHALPLETRPTPAFSPDREIIGSYFLDVRNYRPDVVAKTLHLPMLVLQGGRDIEVSSEADFGAWKSALQSNARVSFRSYPDLTHAFTPAQPSPIFEWWYGEGAHVDARVIDDIAAWINAL